MCELSLGLCVLEHGLNELGIGLVELRIWFCWFSRVCAGFFWLWGFFGGLVCGYFFGFVIFWVVVGVPM